MIFSIKNSAEGQVMKSSSETNSLNVSSESDHKVKVSVQVASDKSHPSKQREDISPLISRGNQSQFTFDQ